MSDKPKRAASDDSAEPSWLASAWAPPEGDRALRSSLGRSQKEAKALWAAWVERAVGAIDAGDAAAMMELKERGFFPERGYALPGGHDGWWLSAFLRNGMKGLMPLLSAFPQQIDQTPALSVIFERAQAFDHSLPRLEEAMAHLPCASGSPWRELSRFGASAPHFMSKAGVKLIRRGLKSGWLGQKELNEGARPLAIELTRLTVEALRRADGEGEARVAREALADIHRVSRAGGAPRPKSEAADMGLWAELTRALSNGHPPSAVQPAFDLMNLRWQKPISQIAREAVREAAEASPMNIAAQPAAAASALRESFVGAMISSRDPAAIAELARLGLLDETPFTLWRQIENPLKARRHWVEARAAAGRPVDMAKRFASLRSSIELCDAPEEQKARWIEQLNEEPEGMPAEPRVSLPFKQSLSPGALILGLVPVGSSSALRLAQALCEAGIEVGRSIDQAEKFFGLKDLRSIPGMRALIERQALEAETAAAGRSAPRLRM